ncbi:GTP-binding protein, HSR1-related [Shewanella sp. ANA-3]|uniref:LeoA/HP0731 family dynamin-like GTPase n=1 Tax=Shewanella sp. (strain ANA-3) TaxID=94122 RepID=UPI00005E12F9|nr:LeoA/HP0731 family dynamin-like GTPase [Shewanella sp. ANA-3]ABK48264.1 GTP-binding protein, HSR1-related [Shewanella sp. ANA-3]
MEQLKQFEVEKQSAISTLQQLKEVLTELGAIGMDVSVDIQKLEAALNTIKDDVLRIALLGAFSDGKTSVIAAWLGKIMADMKIDMDESSDRLAIYRPEGLPDKCEIVDTPGLFGDKQKEDENLQIMYEDITRNYISEAHLILYVVDATNPLKESHHQIVRWVLRDLNKLSSTVFIINKMDEVTDLSDPTLFSEQAAIKTETLKEKLQRAASLTDEEVKALRIVCIASNPNGRGLPFWFEKLDVYRNRSRIDELKKTTTSILDSSVRSTIIAKTGIDVVAGVVSQRVLAAQNSLDELEVFAKQREQECERIREDLNNGKREVKRLAGQLFNELEGLEKQLMGKLRPLDFEDIRPFMEDEIGYTQDNIGYKLSIKIKTIVDSYYDQTSLITSRLNQEINSQLDSSTSFLDSLGSDALKFVGSGLSNVSKISPDAIKATIFVARDLLAKTTGVVYKFKPWQASKLAAGISKWAGPAGMVFSLTADFYNAYKASELEAELKETKNEISTMIKEAFKDLYDIVSDDQKLFDFFAPQLKIFDQLITDTESQVKDIRVSQNSLRGISEKLKSLPSY